MAFPFKICHPLYKFCPFQCLKRNKTQTSGGSDKPCADDQSVASTYANNIPKGKTILDLSPIATLEGVCFDICNNCSGQGRVDHVTDFLGGLLGGTGNKYDTGVIGNVVDVLGPAKCLADQGLQVTGYQACVIPCILNLNVLGICDVQVRPMHFLSLQLY